VAVGAAGQAKGVDVGPVGWAAKQPPVRAETVSARAVGTANHTLLAYPATK
jgi:hypothetical protein